MKEYLQEWVAGMPTTGLRPSTIDGYRRNMDYVIPVWGGRRLDSITTAPSAKSTRHPEASWWTPAELRSFLSATTEAPLGPLLRVAAMTRMRRGVVCGLRWSDVDLDTARIEVRQQLNVVCSPGAPNGGLVFSERTKTDHGRRPIDLDPATVAGLRNQRKRQIENRLLVGASTT